MRTHPDNKFLKQHIGTSLEVYYNKTIICFIAMQTCVLCVSMWSVRVVYIPLIDAAALHFLPEVKHTPREQ